MLDVPCLGGVALETARHSIIAQLAKNRHASVPLEAQGSNASLFLGQLKFPMGQKMGQLEAPKRGYSEKYLGTPNFISLTAFTSHLQYKCSILLSEVNLFLAPNVPFDKSK